MDHWKDRPAAGGDRATSLVEEARADAVAAHAKGLGLLPRIAGKEFVGNPTLPRHGRNLFHLIERVDHTGDLEVAPTARLAALDCARKQLRQRLAPDKGGGRDGSDPANQTIAGVILKVSRHR